MNSEKIIGFLKVINCPKVEEGSPIWVNPIPEKGAKVLIQIEETLFLEKNFLHPKRPKKAFERANHFATSLPPRTTTHCLIHQFGLELPTQSPKTTRYLQ